jgi:hypothetical protein
VTFPTEDLEAAGHALPVATGEPLVDWLVDEKQIPLYVGIVGRVADVYEDDHLSWDKLAILTHYLTHEMWSPTGPTLEGMYDTQGGTRQEAIDYASFVERTANEDAA